MIVMLRWFLIGPSAENCIAISLNFPWNWETQMKVSQGQCNINLILCLVEKRLDKTKRVKIAYFWPLWGILWWFFILKESNGFYNPTTLQPILSPGVVRDHFVGLIFSFFFFNNITLAVKEEAKFCLLGFVEDEDMNNNSPPPPRFTRKGDNKVPTLYFWLIQKSFCEIIEFCSILIRCWCRNWSARRQI